MDPLRATIEEFAAEGPHPHRVLLPAISHDQAKAVKLASPNLDGTNRRNFPRGSAVLNATPSASAHLVVARAIVDYNVRTAGKLARRIIYLLRLALGGLLFEANNQPHFVVMFLITPAKIMRIAPPTAPPAMLPT